jgi:GNAT superfamily N-acetyltransferase
VWLQLIEKIPNPVAEPESMAYITNVYVRPTARGAGMGSRLLAEALDWCRASGADCALLRPTERSRPLYERHGFQTGTRLMEVRFDGEAASGHHDLPGGA